MDCCTLRTWATLLLNTTACVSVQRSWEQDRELGKGMGDLTKKGCDHNCWGNTRDQQFWML